MTKMANQTYITVGKVGSTYGVYGWLKIHTYTEYGMNILQYSPLYLSNNRDGWDEIVVEDSRAYGNGIIIKFAGYDSPEKARLLTGKMLAITRSQLPELKKDEYYWSDLQGLTVINKNGETLGKVIYLIETGSNDVLVVKGTKEYAIPYLFGSVVTSVDLANQVIHVDWDLV